MGIVYQDTADGARSFLDRYGQGGWPNLLDATGQISIDLGVTGPPETFFVDADGIVRARHVGPLTQSEMNAQLTALGHRAVRRYALPVAMAALLALGALALVEALGPGPALTRAEQAAQIAGELRCPDCQSLSVAESQTAAAAAIRRQIVELLAAGQTPEQVRQHFVDRYGEWILLAPRSALVWLLPAAAVLLGIGVLAWWLRRGRSTVGPAPQVASDPIRDRIRDEVEQLDA